MKPQFKPEEIYIDLSKLSEEQINKIESLIGAQIWRGNLLLHLHDKKKIWWAFEVWQSKTNKTELTYSQFLDMMGESEEVLQVENECCDNPEIKWNKVEINIGDKQGSYKDLSFNFCDNCGYTTNEELS